MTEPIQTKKTTNHRTVVWFSCGAASACAAKLAPPDASVVYCDTLATEHRDNARFLLDVQKWIGRPIEVIRSDEYATVDEVFERERFMSGPHGARCTVEMKKVPRFAYQRADDIHVFGFTLDEPHRIARAQEENPELRFSWVLRDAGITKARCYEMIAAAGIPMPVMYRLGFDHNNCLACVKATSPNYWKRVRHYFPAEFERRAKQSRDIGARLVRIDGERRFLDELPAGRPTGPDGEDIECGPICQTTMELSA